MTEWQESIDGLQTAYNQDLVLKALIDDAFAKYKIRVSEVPLDLLLKRIGGQGFGKPKLLAALRKLHQLELGVYIKGSHGHKSRFAFSQGLGPKQIANMAIGSELEAGIEDPINCEARIDDDFDIDSFINVNMVKHKFRLREHLDIIVELPADLKLTEAKRLGLWLKSIPMDSDGDEY